jgi:uncharacterized alkaline shock family protein YloU
MNESISTPGKTTIALDVLLTIAKLTTLNVPGVSKLSTIPRDGVKKIFKRNQQFEGVYIEVKDETVYVNLYVVIKSEVNIQDVSLSIQKEVARAISEMVGMRVGRINIHVEDIDYAAEPKG